MAESLPLRFDIYRGGELVRFEELEQDMIKVGKLSSSHLRLDDADVSRMHAVIEVSQGTTAHIIDLGSARGTLVNGERINKHRLQTGDRVQLGHTTLVVWVGEADVQRARDGEVALSPTAAAEGGASVAAASAQAAAATQQPAKSRFEVGAVQHYYLQQERARMAREAAEGAAMEVDDPSKGERVEVLEISGDTVHSVKLYPPGQDVILGPDPRAKGFFSRGGADYVVDTEPLGAREFPLIKAVGDSFGLVFTKVMSGQVQSPGESPVSLMSLVDAGSAIASPDVEGAYQYMLPSGTSARINIGGGTLWTFLLRVVPAPRALGVGGTSPMSRSELGYMLVSIFFHALFLFLVFVVPPELEGFRLDSFDASNRFIQILVRPERQEEPDVPDWFKEMRERKKKSPARAKEKEGKMGKKDSTDKNKRFAVKGPKDNKTLEIRREEMRKKVRNVGALKALGGGGLSAIWGRSDRTVGADAIHAIGNWAGSSVGDARGFGGFGVGGIGRGGGGFSDSSIGLGSLGTMGRGGGKAGYGRGAGNLGERAGKTPKVIAGRAVVTGALDKAIIRRVINKNRAGIRFCYEKELQKRKDLHGKVVISFTIGPSGRVLESKIKQSTMKNKAVESCIKKRVKRFKFPSPKGGGIVQVSYPFIFKAS